MSKRRTIAPSRTVAPAGEPDSVIVEAVAKFRHDAVYRRPGEQLAMTTRDAQDLIALGFARLAPRSAKA